MIGEHLILNVINIRNNKSLDKVETIQPLVREIIEKN